MSELKHSTLGASASHRWLACPGSVNAERGLPDTPSAFAEWGTAAHDAAEKALTGKTNLDDLSDREMADCVMVYTDYVQALSVGADLVLIEQRVNYSDWVPGGFGTADAIIVRGNALYVSDLKTGMGVQVHAEDNSQGMLYALGAYAEVGHIVDIDRVCISIVQPRLDHISEWEVSVDDLLQWAEWVTQRAEATRAKDAPRHPGERQCRFCKAKHNCKALADHVSSVLLTGFDNLDQLPNPDTLSDEQIGAALSSKGLIDGWMNAVTSHVAGRLESGDGFPGFKLVAGRSSRSWIDEDLAEAKLVNMIGPSKATVTKVITPAQAEKALGAKRKAEVSDMISTSPGKPTLAPDSDKRPAIGVAIDDFDVVE